MYNDIFIYCTRIVFDKRSTSYLYTETYRLPVSGLDECTYICFCQVCTYHHHHHHHHHHFRCLHNYRHYWTSLRKRSFLLNRNNTYCCPLWFSWKPFQNLNLHKCIYRAIYSPQYYILKLIVPVVLFSLYWPLSLSMSIVITSSSSSSLLPSPSSSLKSLLIWNYKLCSVTDLSLSERFCFKKLHLCVKHCELYVFNFFHYIFLSNLSQAVYVKLANLS